MVTVELDEDGSGLRWNETNVFSYISSAQELLCSDIVAHFDRFLSSSIYCKMRTISQEINI